MEKVHGHHGVLSRLCAAAAAALRPMIKMVLLHFATRGLCQRTHTGVSLQLMMIMGNSWSKTAGMSGTVYSNNWTDTITANSTYSTIVGETYDVGKNNAVVSVQ